MSNHQRLYGVNVLKFSNFVTLYIAYQYYQIRPAFTELRFAVRIGFFCKSAAGISTIYPNIQTKDVYGSNMFNNLACGVCGGQFGQIESAKLKNCTST